MAQFMKICRTNVTEPRVVQVDDIAYFDYLPDKKVALVTKRGEDWPIDQDQDTIEKMIEDLGSGASLIDY